MHQIIKMCIKIISGCANDSAAPPPPPQQSSLKLIWKKLSLSRMAVAWNGYWLPHRCLLLRSHHGIITSGV